MKKETLMQKMVRLFGVVCLASLISASMIACGGGPSFDNVKVDSNKELKDLNETEKQNLIDAVQAELKPLQPVMCKILGIMNAAFAGFGGGDPKAMCEKAETQCTEQDLFQKETTDDTYKNCSATVGEFTTCMKAKKAQFEELDKTMKDYSCGNLPKEGEGESKEPTISMENPESCKQLETKCPEFKREENATP